MALFSKATLSLIRTSVTPVFFSTTNKSENGSITNSDTKMSYDYLNYARSI